MPRLVTPTSDHALTFAGFIDRGHEPLPKPMRIKRYLWFLTLWAAFLPILTFLMRVPRPWEDACVLGVVITSTGAGRRSASLLLSATLFWASTALQLPAYFVCFVPALWLWRYSVASS